MDNHIMVKEHLDHAIAIVQWIQHFYKVTITHFEVEESYHALILLQTIGEKMRMRRPFRFLQAWTTDGTSHQLVKKVWNQEASINTKYARLSHKLTNIARDLKRWNKIHFGYTNT